MKHRGELVSVRTIERLILYRRLLRHAQSEGVTHIYSHELAEKANNTSAQVRRDLMVIGCTGSSKNGYLIDRLLGNISQVLDKNGKRNIALVGIGNLGRAILSYFSYQQPQYTIVAAFDTDANKTGPVIAGCRCYAFADLSEKVAELDISLGIITVPTSHAQSVADQMIDSGITGILNFAPIPLRVPEHVFSDQIDITLALEKVAFLSANR